MDHEGQIGLATVGTSGIVERALAAVAQVPALRHVAAYSREAARAAALLGPFGGLVADDLRALAEAPEVDAVYVASPNALHAEQAQLLIEAGKHVLVEKSATTNAEEFVALRASARSHGVVLMEASRNGGFDPGVVAIASLLPELGTVRQARFEYAQRSSRYDRFLAGGQVNIFDRALSAGALMDLGVYCAHLAVEIFGPPEAVAGARSVSLRAGIDGAGVVLLAYGGSTVTLAYSKVSDGRAPSEIQGEEATLVIDSPHDPRVLRVVSRSGAVREATVDKPEDNMVHEFAELARLVVSGEDADRWNEVTQARLHLTDEVRAMIGLSFPADARRG